MQEQTDERISARFETELMAQIDAMVQTRGYVNRSEFLRTAARTLIDAKQHENTVSITLAPLMKQFLDAMVDKGFYKSHEHAIQAALDHFFTKERVEEACKTMKHMEIAAGRKADVEVETDPRQIISQ